MNKRLILGSTIHTDGKCRFVVWAPSVETLEVHVTSPQDQVIRMDRIGKGYYSGVVEGLVPGSLYFYRLNQQKERPDPASRFQPQGVHGPSEVVDTRFNWTDTNWPGIELKDYIIYELHVGTFTSDGAFEAIIPCLKDLKSLGVTAVELMPVAQFPGHRNSR